MKKKKKELTPRQRKFIQGLATGTKTATQAAIDAGYTSKYPGQAAGQVLETLRSKMPEVLDRHGLTDDTLIEKYLKPLMVAKTTKHFAHNGRVVSKRDYSDNDTRRQTLDMAFKLKGSYAPKTDEEARISQQFMGPTVLILDIPRPKRAVSTATEAQE